jgi:hypothetical protein
MGSCCCLLILLLISRFMSVVSCDYQWIKHFISFVLATVTSKLLIIRFSLLLTWNRVETAYQNRAIFEAERFDIKLAKGYTMTSNDQQVLQLCIIIWKEILSERCRQTWVSKKDSIKFRFSVHPGNVTDLTRTSSYADPEPRSSLKSHVESMLVQPWFECGPGPFFSKSRLSIFDY